MPFVFSLKKRKREKLKMTKKRDYNDFLCDVAFLLLRLFSILRMVNCVLYGNVISSVRLVILSILFA